MNKLGSAIFSRLVIIIPYAWLLFFFLIPFFIVFRISLSTTAIAQPPYEPVFALADGLSGIMGKIGQFDVVNNGIQILTERIRLVLRSAMDRLGQKVAATWSISTSFPVPSDITAQSGPERYKRGIVLEHAL